MSKFQMAHMSSEVENLTIFTGMVGATLLSSTTANPVELFPLSAGITGAMLSVWLSQRDGQLANRSQIALSFVAGVASALFIAPMFANHLIPAILPPPDLSSKAFIHLVVGLIGSTAIDMFWEKRRKILDKAEGKIVAHWMGNVVTLSEASPKEAAKPTTLNSEGETEDMNRPILPVHESVK